MTELCHNDIITLIDVVVVVVVLSAPKFSGRSGADQFGRAILLNEKSILMAVTVEELLSAPVLVSIAVAAHLVGKSSSNEMLIVRGTMAVMVELLFSPAFSGIVDTMVVTMVVTLLLHFLVDLVLKTRWGGESSLNEMLKLTDMIEKRPLVLSKIQ
jgi:hypothetical protein